MVVKMFVMYYFCLKNLIRILKIFINIKKENNENMKIKYVFVFYF